MKKVFLIIGLLLSLLISHAQNVNGSWSGILQLQAKELNVVFNITKNGDNYITTMDSPSQNVYGFSTTSTEFKDSILTIRMDNANMSYQGRLVAEGRIRGVFTQMGKLYSLDITNNEKNKVKSTAKKSSGNYHNYSYYVDTVSVDNASNAMITIPVKKGKTPAIIIECEQCITTSETAFNKNNNINQLIDYLTSNGFTVLYSNGEQIDTTAAISYLKTISTVNQNKISILKISDHKMVAKVFSDHKKNMLIKEITNSNNKISAYNQLTNWLLRTA